MNIDSIRGELSSIINYQKGFRLRKELHAHSKLNYTPMYEDCVYIAFMNDNACTFTVNHPQSQNHPYYFILFTVASQHVMGDCVHSCLDAALNKIKGDL